MLKIEVKDIKHIHGDVWLVIYYESLPCMCKSERLSIKIESKEKPTENEVISRIKGIRF